MNESRRRVLRGVITDLNRTIHTIEGIQDEERISMENIPENLQGSENYDMMEEAIDALDDAIGSIQSATESIDEACR